MFANIEGGSSRGYRSLSPAPMSAGQHRNTVADDAHACCNGCCAPLMWRIVSCLGLGEEEDGGGLRCVCERA